MKSVNERIWYYYRNALWSDINLRYLIPYQYTSNLINSPIRVAIATIMADSWDYWKDNP